MADIAGCNGRRLQIKATRRNGWSKARRTTFLSVLAATCNATLAARTAGKHVRSARELRHRDGEFSRLWQEALEVGYERLETELLARALGQVSSGDNPDLDEIMTEPAVLPDFDPQLAIAVLKLRGDRGGQAGRKADRKAGQSVRRTQAEIDAALLQRIDAIVALRR